MVCIMTAFMLLTIIPMQLNAASVITPSSMTTTKPVPSPEADALLARLNEIKSMDKSNMRSAEKKQLRKEARSIKSQLKAINGGVYLSAGAIILVVLLLVLLL